MRKKILEYVLAIAVIAGLAGLLWLIATAISNPTAEVGVVTVISGGREINPYGDQIYTTVKKEKTTQKRLVPEDILGDIDYIPYDDNIKVQYDGKSDTGGFLFTIYKYDEEADKLKMYEDNKTFFTPLTEQGTYVVCIECFWGTERDNIGAEYYFGLIVDKDSNKDNDK